MAASKSVQSGKMYLSVRCNGVNCGNALVYAGRPDRVELNLQDDFERRYKAICPSYEQSVLCTKRGAVNRATTTVVCLVLRERSALAVGTATPLSTPAH